MMDYPCHYLYSQRHSATDKAAAVPHTEKQPFSVRLWDVLPQGPFQCVLDVLLGQALTPLKARILLF